MKFKTNKNKIIAAVIIVALLAVSFVFGGSYPESTGGDISASADKALLENEEVSSYRENSEDSTYKERLEKDIKADKSSENNSEIRATTRNDKENISGDEKSTTDKSDNSKDQSSKNETGKETDTNKTSGTSKTTNNKTNEPATSKNETTKSNNITSDKATETSKGKPNNNPEPVPDEKPLPVDPGSENKNVEYTATLSVNCGTILNNMDLLEPEKVDMIPANGVIYPKTTVKFEKGESVFDVLNREMRNAKIHLEFTNVPAYNSAYIEGINNIYEFDCGELSGWMYKVNGGVNTYGSSSYEIQDGDAIEWVYTCDLGADVGGSN